MGKNTETTIWFKDPVKMETEGENVKITGILSEEGSQNMNEASFDEKANRVKTYIEDTIDIINLEVPEEYFYSCLPLCLLDAIYSIGVKYSSTRNVVKRYCDKLHIDEFRDSKTELPECEPQRIDDLITTIGETEEEIKAFAAEVVENLQKTSSSNGILKAEAVLKCACVLRDGGIQTIRDFDNIMSQGDSHAKGIEKSFKNVEGQHSGISLAYLKMLCGDANTLKPDRHILRFLSRALGYDVDKAEAEKIIPRVTEELKKENSNLTVRGLDYAIWNKMRSEG